MHRWTSIHDRAWSPLLWDALFVSLVPAGSHYNITGLRLGVVAVGLGAVLVTSPGFARFEPVQLPG